MIDFRWPPPPAGGPGLYPGPTPRGPYTGRPSLAPPPTELVETPHGVTLERLCTGDGEPVTVFAHGLGQSIAETRPLGSGVPGTKVFFQFRGHGRSDAPDGRWTYEDLARDLRAVADQVAATRAVGVSMGAGALCRLLADSPDRFDRVVFFLPAVLDRPRQATAQDRLAALHRAISTGDPAAVAEVVAREVPEPARDTQAAAAFIAARVNQLLRDGLAAALADLTGQVAVADRSVLSGVDARALVIAARGDDLHPVPVAEELAAALRHATLHVYDEPGVLWLARADLRQRISSFLSG